MLSVFAHVQAQAAAIEALEARMAAGDHGDALLAEYGTAQERFEHEGGYDYETRIAQVLEGLNFPKEQWETPLAHLSGGQKTRVLLARLLLEQPHLLILDEPTNHLDVETVEWLEQRLRTWPGAFLVVSHDRYFLDNVVDRIWEMSRISLAVYKGNYSAYVDQRQERWERQQRTYEESKERLEKELDFIRRNMAGQRTNMAKGKLKRLSRELVAIEELGLEAASGLSWSETGIGGVSVMGVEEAWQRIRAIPPPPNRPPVLSMQLKAQVRGGAIVVRTHKLEIGYPGTPLFHAGDIELHRQECAALIGPNGAGKTTFLRTVLGQLAPLAGEVRLGANLRLGYFAQAHDGLNLENTVLEELLRHRHMTLEEGRDHLARYVFRGDDVFKRVGSLSGGERGRLALAILALQGANVLLLDEPTNHLDIPAQEVLQEGLERFEGTMLMVSHDRYLVDRLATQIWEVRDGQLHVFNGSYRELMAVREREAAQAKAAPKEQPAKRAPGEQSPPPRKPAAQRPAAAAPAQLGQNGSGQPTRASRKQAQAVSRLEAQIAELEARVADRERELQHASEAGDYQAVQQLAEAHTATRAELDEALAEWVALAAS